MRLMPAEHSDESALVSEIIDKTGHIIQDITHSVNKVFLPNILVSKSLQNTFKLCSILSIKNLYL